MRLEFARAHAPLIILSRVFELVSVAEVNNSHATIYYLSSRHSTWTDVYSPMLLVDPEVLSMGRPNAGAGTE